jgi:small conductance mechanosensitive channel
MNTQENENQADFAQKEQDKRKKQKSLHRIICYIILLIVVMILTNPGTLFFLPQESRENLTNIWSNLLGDVTQITKIASFNIITLLQLVVMIIVMLLVYSIAQLCFEKCKPTTARGKTLVSIAKSIASYAAVLFGIFWGLAIIGVNVSTLFASAGIIALIVSFGAESLIADVVTGCFMLFENQYQVGDIVEVDGFRGTVTNITIRTTSVTDSGDNTKIFNNSDMRNIINLSNKLSAAVCDITVDYSVNLVQAREVLNELLEDIREKYSDLFPQTPEYLGVQELGDSAVMLRIVAHVEENDRFNAFRVLNEELKTGMENAGMPCPFPQIVVHREG